MLKYLKYFLPSITAIAFIKVILMGEWYPTVFLINFSLLLIFGDLIMPRDTKFKIFHIQVY